MITTMMGVIIVIMILVFLIVLVLKMTKKLTHNMILISRYRDSDMVENGPKNSGKAPPPHFFRAKPPFEEKRKTKW